MAVNRSDRSVTERVIAYWRLPLQVPLVVWACQVAQVDLR
jgi:hypothetical protein